MRIGCEKVCKLYFMGYVTCACEALGNTCPHSQYCIFSCLVQNCNHLLIHVACHAQKERIKLTRKTTVRWSHDDTKAIRMVHHCVWVNCIQTQLTLHFTFMVSPSNNYKPQTCHMLTPDTTKIKTILQSVHTLPIIHA